MFTNLQRIEAAATAPAKGLPIERLHNGAQASLVAHLLALSVPDRRLRFGYAIAASSVATYVDRIDFARDAVLGVHDQALLVGVAHIAFPDGPAEVALSVLPPFRGKGIATALFADAVARARRRAVGRISMLFAACNVPILRIARRFGMAVRVRGGEAEARGDVRLVAGTALTDELQTEERS